MTARTMTEPEAWREIGPLILEGEWSRLGMCREALERKWKGDVTDATSTEMCKRACRHALFSNSRHNGHAYPAGTKPEARALAALWLALEAEEEGA
jgi:hypothetical protein